ncbi:MAG: hypothetical protein QNJ48_07325 [Desulfobacterales bacterium]|nr:hypothetical protein [Desulfobacterales bacterium]
MKKRWIATCIFLFLVFNFPVLAAPVDTFHNGVATDQVFLLLVDDNNGQVSFDGWAREWFFTPETPFSWPTITNPWTTDMSQGHLLSASGDTFGTGWRRGHFTVNVINDNLPFTMEYAYLLNDIVVDTGTGYWDGNAWASWDNNFTSTIPNPIGGTIGLLASGLMAVVGIRRRKHLAPE